MQQRHRVPWMLGVSVGLCASSALAASGEPLRLYTGERNRETIFGRVTDEHGKPVRAMVELWYHDISQPITVEERDGGPRSIPLAEQYQRTLYQTDFTTEKGWYHVDAIAGDWLVRVHKGPEWSIEEFRVTVRNINGTTELDGQRHDVKLEHLYDMKKYGWYSGDVHSHSVFSDGTQNPTDMSIAWRANGVDFAALSDHNQNFQHEEFDELTDDDFLAFSSVEVTTSTPLVAQRAIDETHAMGGLFHPTHSCWSNDWPAGTFSSWGEVQGFDSIDVFTGWDVGPHLPTVLASEYGESIFGTAQFNMNTVCTQIWFEFLNAGNKIAGWANSDTHDVHSLLTTGAGAPVYWRNTEPGDTVRVPRQARSIDLDVKVLSNRELRGYDAGIRVIQDGKLAKVLPTHEFEGERTLAARTSLPVVQDGWVVVQAFGDWPSMAMTNAIYVDVPPYDDGPSGWQVPPGATGWFNPFATVDGDTCTFNVPAQSVPDQTEVTPPIPLPPVNRCQYRIFR
jgi:hypothetical protein